MKMITSAELNFVNDNMAKYKENSKFPNKIVWADDPTFKLNDCMRQHDYSYWVISIFPTSEPLYYHWTSLAYLVLLWCVLLSVLRVIGPFLKAQSLELFFWTYYVTPSCHASKSSSEMIFISNNMGPLLISTEKWGRLFYYRRTVRHGLNEENVLNFLHTHQTSQNDFFSGDKSKENNEYMEQPATILDLRAAIENECVAISNEMIHNQSTHDIKTVVTSDTCTK